MYVRAEEVFSHKKASLVNQSGSMRLDPYSIRNMRTSSRRRLSTVPRESKSDIEWTCLHVVHHCYRSVKNMFKIWFKCFACKRLSVWNVRAVQLVRLSLSLLPPPTPPQHSQDSSSSFSFVKMSSPVHVPSSGEQISIKYSVKTVSDENKQLARVWYICGFI